MPKILADAMLVLALCACSSGEEAVTATTSTVINSSMRTAVPEAAVPIPTVSIPPKVSSATPSVITTISPTTAAPGVPAVTLDDVTSDCGPADGNWVRGSATALETKAVFAQLSVDGVTYGRSEAVVLEAGVPTPIGFDPQRPSATFGKTGRFEVVLEGTTSVVAAAAVVLELPDGVSCG